jgi:hypothetical protein
MFWSQCNYLYFSEENIYALLFCDIVSINYQHLNKIITVIFPKKSPGYDLITGKSPKELPTIGIQYLTQLLKGTSQLKGK